MVFGGMKNMSTFAPRLRESASVKADLRGNSSVGRAQPCQGWGREFESRFPLLKAQVAELVDAHVSGACVARRAGSSPVLGTVYFNEK